MEPTQQWSIVTRKPPSATIGLGKMWVMIFAYVWLIAHCAYTLYELILVLHAT